MRLRHLLCGIVACVVAGSAWARESQTDYFAIFMAGKKVGHSKHVRTVADKKVTNAEDMEVSISRGPASMTLRLSQTTVETIEGKPLSFKTVQDMGVVAQQTEGVIEGNQMRIKTGSADEVKESTMPWPEGALMSQGAHLLAVKKGLKEGTRYSVSTFEPASMNRMEVTVTVGAKKNVDLLGRVVPLTEVSAAMKTDVGEVVATSYVDDNQDLQKTVVPLLGLSLELVACSEKFALSKNDVLDFFQKVLVESPIPLSDVAADKSITYHLTPTGESRLHVPSGDNQSVKSLSGGGLEVKVRTVRPANGTAFPYKGDDKTALAAMKPAKFLQSDQKVVMDLAREAVGDTKDAAEAVSRIEAFARKHVNKKNLSVGYASAAEVAVSKEGDCSEHAVLVAGMCRSVGIPAQVVLGMAYVGEFAARKDVFVPHAWVRAFVDAKWVYLDAALPRCDARRIALAAGDGDLDAFFDMVSTLGYFKIEKVAVEE